MKKSLKNKGFVKDNSLLNEDHDYYHYHHNGKKVGKIFVKISRGSGYDEYGKHLFVNMKKQLSLDKVKEVEDLLNCPMDKKQYEEILLEKGQIDSNN